MAPPSFCVYVVMLLNTGTLLQGILGDRVHSGAGAETTTTTQAVKRSRNHHAGPRHRTFHLSHFSLSHLGLEAAVGLQLRLQDATILANFGDVQEGSFQRLRYLNVARHRA